MVAVDRVDGSVGIAMEDDGRHRRSFAPWPVVQLQPMAAKADGMSLDRAASQPRWTPARHLRAAGLHCTPWGEGEQAVLDYLARYVFRVAITNTRIVGLDDQAVTIRHKGKRWWVRLHEKAGKQHEMPKCRRITCLSLSRRVCDGGGGPERRKRRLYFGRSAAADGRKKKRSPKARQDARRMIVRRAVSSRHHREASGYHTFWATGLSVYLLNGGCSTAGCSNTPSRWRRTSARARRSCMIVETARSRLDQVERIVL